ncbi:hypothetical protein [Cellulosilyticum sp. I15G10I2]|uniref:hypothetical protein n=1 Tax=Cellulosilyticum sp. I15G10I2 TaxID=1892843 RepID=UPI00085C723E|nr:hypothetical protein [Cellulosilyticum sp. I15G10I2]
MNNANLITKQYLLSPAAGKRLIAKALLSSASIADALENRTIVIVAGTTNAYVAEEFLSKIGQASDFSMKNFFRGITLPPVKTPANASSSPSDQNQFLGDVVIVKGKWDKGKTIFDVADSLQQGDIIIKGANAVNVESQQAAIYIGHPTGGTISAALQAVIGKRVELYLPVGLEKRISGDIHKIARKLNSPNASGPRYMPVSGNIITELDAVRLLTGAYPELVACGGVCGAEGSCWIAATGTAEQLEHLDGLMPLLKNEPNFSL